MEAQNYEERVAILIRVIEVMMVLLDLNNFNGVIAIVSALGSGCVHRLRFTFAGIPKRYEAFYLECGELIEKHNRKYQAKLRSINPPCVPFCGMYLTNFVHIEEAMTDFLVNNENLINFSKRRRFAEIIGEIQQFQNQPYCLTPEPKIRHFLENLDPLKDMTELEFSNELYDKSNELELKNAKQPAKFPRCWPDMNLKSPGIKPKNRSQSHSSNSNPLMQSTLPFVSRATATSLSSAAANNNEPQPEHSPPSLSAHDYAIFANVQIITSTSNNNSSSFLSHSNVSLNTISPSAVDPDSTLLSPAAMVPSSAPEIPRRSNSVISITSYESSKPILSPRYSESVNHLVTRSQSSRLALDSLNEESSPALDNFAHQPPVVSPRMDKPFNLDQDGVHPFVHTVVSGSPIQHAPPPPTSVEQHGDIGAIPISPHVNVPHQPFSSHRAPPLPPRTIPRRIEKLNVDTSHIQQAPDAPQVC